MKEGIKLLEALREVAPQVVFSVGREPDDDARWPQDCGERGNFDPYNYDFKAFVIERGELIEREAYLGGCWDDGPMDVECGGYLPQKLQEAAQDLRSSGDCRHALHINQLDAAIILLQQELETRYAEQMKTPQK